LIYVLFGSDSFSRTGRLRDLKRELDADGSLESNTAEFDSREATPAEVIAACSTVPFLGGRRLVVLEGALGQGTGAGGGRPPRRKQAAGGAEPVEKGPWWALVAYAPEMPESTTLVLLDRDSVDEELLDSLKPFATVERFALPGPKEIAAWVQRRARERGLDIDGRACSVIADLIGDDTWSLASEIEKLRVYANGGRVTEADARALVPDVRDRSGYLLADAVSDGKPAEATRLLHQLLAKGHPPPVLLLTIENRYRRLAVAREMMDGGATGTQIGAKLGISGYGLERLLDQASRMSIERVRWALDRIAQSDHDLKEGLYESEQLALDLLVQDLALEPDWGTARSQRVSAPARSS
jgi:DNA polymerase-3 subunit delta